MKLSPVTLRGSMVRLEPLTTDHATRLAAVGLQAGLWRLQPRSVASLADMEEYINQALSEQACQLSLPFAIVRHADDAMIGSTRLMDFAPVHRRVEIGATWLVRAAQRTGANVEAKLLLLSHAFDTIGVQKVVFKTETLNVQSRAAILALGAMEEGVFRKHLIAESGRARDMVYFSILDDEWPAIRDRLRARLARFAIGGKSGCAHISTDMP